ncbi:hypothetical protein N7456_007134 [Penicillium angulare]|uniref:Uncharacterized protein n=1 Tax=Penicillium angulare TaxID=116970 RepID=A0A9W9FJ30_9EURO|nr:hypothetical protein N7456_007134 [Penicillium angulare]
MYHILRKRRRAGVNPTGGKSVLLKRICRKRSARVVNERFSRHRVDRWLQKTSVGESSQEYCSDSSKRKSSTSDVSDIRLPGV